MKRLVRNVLLGVSLLLGVAAAALWVSARQAPWVLHRDEEGSIAVGASARGLEIQNHWDAAVPEPERLGWGRPDTPFQSLFAKGADMVLALENGQRLVIHSHFDHFGFGYRKHSVMEFHRRLASRSSAVAVPYWLMMLAGFAFPAVRLVTLGGRRRRRRMAAGLCVECGYDLRASAGRCPECGNIRPAEALSKG